MERNTMQKDIIYSSLCRLANHPTAEDVYECVHREYPSISRATVYRVLNKLADKGTILKVSINNGADHFDHQTFKHFHVRCAKCGGVYDVELSRLDNPLDGVKTSSGCRITGYTIQFDGICPECMKKGESVNGQ